MSGSWAISMLARGRPNEFMDQNNSQQKVIETLLKENQQLKPEVCDLRWRLRDCKNKSLCCLTTTKQTVTNEISSPPNATQPQHYSRETK